MLLLGDCLFILGLVLVVSLYFNPIIRVIRSLHMIFMCTDTTGAGFNSRYQAASESTRGMEPIEKMGEEPSDANVGDESLELRGISCRQPLACVQQFCP